MPGASSTAEDAVDRVPSRTDVARVGVRNGVLGVQDEEQLVAEDQVLALGVEAAAHHAAPPLWTANSYSAHGRPTLPRQLGHDFGEVFGGFGTGLLEQPPAAVPGEPELVTGPDRLRVLGRRARNDEHLSGVAGHSGLGLLTGIAYGIQAQTQVRWQRPQEPPPGPERPEGPKPPERAAFEAPLDRGPPPRQTAARRSVIAVWLQSCGIARRGRGDGAGPRPASPSGSRRCSPERRRRWPAGVPDRSEGLPWPEGRKAGLSLTFDDARESQVDVGSPSSTRSA